jgi:hypothetical protein
VFEQVVVASLHVPPAPVVASAVQIWCAAHFAPPSQ